MFVLNEKNLIFQILLFSVRCKKPENSTSVPECFFSVRVQPVDAGSEYRGAFPTSVVDFLCD